MFQGPLATSFNLKSVLHLDPKSKQKDCRLGSFGAFSGKLGLALLGSRSTHWFDQRGTIHVRAPTRPTRSLSSGIALWDGGMNCAGFRGQRKASALDGLAAGHQP